MSVTLIDYHVERMGLALLLANSALKGIQPTSELSKIFSGLRSLRKVRKEKCQTYEIIKCVENRSKISGNRKMESLCMCRN